MDPVIERAIEKKKRKIVKAILKWGREHARAFPWRENRDPYKVLVAEVILRRTTAKAANRIYEEFLRRYPNLETLTQAREGDLESILSAVGYHKRRASILKEIASFIISEFGGVIPRTKADLLRVPHIGHYIAGSILSLGYGIRSAMVDSNVQRIISRVFAGVLPLRKRPELIIEIAEALVPVKGHETFNFGMLDLGALICRYDKRLCWECPIKEVCDSATGNEQT
ncbi:MAG: hypothetical protein QXO15_12935 [Nitrososphaerota archaeon]